MYVLDALQLEVEQALSRFSWRRSGRNRGRGHFQPASRGLEREVLNTAMRVVNSGGASATASADSDITGEEASRSGDGRGNIGCENCASCVCGI